MVLSEYGICGESIFVFICVVTLKPKYSSIERSTTNTPPHRSYENSAPGMRELITWYFYRYVIAFFFQ